MDGPAEVRNHTDEDCNPQCDGIECGGDGCGGTCGECLTGSVCIDGLCAGACEAAALAGGSAGCEFWPVDLDNAFVPGGESGYYDAAGAQFSVIVANMGLESADISVSNVDGPVTSDSKDMPFPVEPLPSGEMRTYNLPRRDADGTVVADVAYRVESSKPVVAFQFNPLENEEVFSNDASLLLPEGALGQEYYVLTREQTFDELRSYATVVAVMSGETTVTVDVFAPTLEGLNNSTGQVIPAYQSGDSFAVSLNQYDVLNLETDAIGADMTGTRIVSTQPVAVFGGSEASNAPNTNHCLLPQGVCEWDMETSCSGNEDCTSKFNTCCADHLEHQLWPVKNWGKHYLAAKTYPRNLENDVYRIIAAKDGTTVTTNPEQLVIPTLNAGEWIDFESKEHFEVVADKPILAGQFLASEHSPEPNVNGVPQPGDAGIGDPAFILLIPQEKLGRKYAYVTPNTYELDYVTIIAKSGSKVWLDCPSTTPEEAAADCGDPVLGTEFEAIADTGFSCARLAVSDGPHAVISSQQAAVYAYGYDEYVSYGYAGGFNTGPQPPF